MGETGRTHIDSSVKEFKERTASEQDVMGLITDYMEDE
jgi:hypothetical protein